MNKDKVKLSPQAFQKLKEELEYLETEGRKKIAEMLKIAASHGDLSENAEYSIAKDEQAKLEARISEIKKIIENAEIVNQRSKDFIDIGSKVELLDLNTNSKINIEIVSFNEVNPLLGKISENSPLGKLLMGKKEGEEIFYEVNNKKFHYRILKIF